MESAISLDSKKLSVFCFHDQNAQPTGCPPTSCKVGKTSAGKRAEVFGGGVSNLFSKADARRNIA